MGIAKMTEAPVKDIRKEIVLSLELSAYFPEYQELEKLHQRLVSKKKYSGVGPSGVFTAICKWVLDGIKLEDKQENIYTNNIPELAGDNKQGRKYEELFIKAGITLWRMLPRGVKGVFPVHFKCSSAVFIIVYDANGWDRHEYADNVEPEAFYRRNKKLQKMGSGARVWVIPERPV